MGLREALYDATNTAMSYPGLAVTAQIGVDYADAAGTANDPALVVVYDTPPPAGTVDDHMITEVTRNRGVATIVHFPLFDINRNLVSGATALDSEIDTYADATNPDGFADCTNEAVEIGSTGWYRLALTAVEMDFDYITVRVRSAEALEQVVMINSLAEHTGAEIADAFLARNIAGGANSSPSVKEALWTMRGQIILDTVGLTITVKDTAGTTVWSGPITLAARGGIITVEPTS